MTRDARMPTIEFSDEADYDGLFTLLDKADFLYDFRLANGEVITGRFFGNEDDTMIVQIYENSDPTGTTVQFHADDLVKVVYL